MISPDLIPIFGVLLFIGIIVLIVYLAVQYEKKRTAAFKRFASKNGMEYTSSESVPRSFQLFRKGSRPARHVLRRAGKPVKKIFEYTYNSGSGSSKSSYTQTVFMAQYDAGNLPSFILQKENLFHKLGGMLGLDDIDFSRYPKFSDRYLLKGNDESKIRALFTPEVVRYFENKKTSNGVVECNGSSIIYYVPGRIVKPEDLNKQFEDFNLMIGQIAKR